MSSFEYIILVQSLEVCGKDRSFVAVVTLLFVIVAAEFWWFLWNEIWIDEWRIGSFNEICIIFLFQINNYRLMSYESPVFSYGPAIVSHRNRKLWVISFPLSLSCVFSYFIPQHLQIIANVKKRKKEDLVKTSLTEMFERINWNLKPDIYGYILFLLWTSCIYIKKYINEWDRNIFLRFFRYKAIKHYSMCSLSSMTHNRKKGKKSRSDNAAGT